MEATMRETGTAALAALLRRLRQMDDGMTPEQVAATAWPEFKAAVRAAISEGREKELEGLQRWREERHGSSDPADRGGA